MRPRNCVTAASTPTDGPDPRSGGRRPRDPRDKHRRRGEQHGRHREGPPQQDERGAARTEPLEDFTGGPAKDVGILEARRRVLRRRR